MVCAASRTVKVLDAPPTREGPPIAPSGFPLPEEADGAAGTLADAGAPPKGWGEQCPPDTNQPSPCRISTESSCSSGSDSSLWHCNDGRSAAARLASDVGAAVSVPDLLPNSALDSLSLGRVVGRWGAALVYRGSWHSVPVAVTVSDHTLSDVSEELVLQRALQAAFYSEALQHPNLVPLYCCSIEHPFGPCACGCCANGPCNAPGDPLCGEEVAWRQHKGRMDCCNAARMQVWAVSELCDRGTLESAIRQGALQHPGAPGAPPGAPAPAPHLQRIVHTALGIASALHALHSHGIVHGELSSASVLLCNSKGAAARDCPFTAKIVSAFQQLTHAAAAKAAAGRDDLRRDLVPYTAPEVLIGGQAPGPASNIYSLGVLLWEMLSGQMACAQASPSKCVRRMLQRRDTLPQLFNCPPRFQALVSACTALDPLQRPTAAQVVCSLEGALVAMSCSHSLGLQPISE